VKLAVLEVATGKPTHLGIKDVVIKPLAGQSQLPHHAMHDSIFACILEPRKKSPKHIAVRITLAWTSGCQVEVSRLFEELGGLGYGSALGIVLPAAASHPGIFSRNVEKAWLRF
jgi:hypothetical protein